MGRDLLKTAAKAGLLDAAMAAFAGAAVAFVIWAMPDGTFAGLIEASRLPLLLPAAQPPLGFAARFGVAALAGLFTFALLFALFRSLGAAPVRASVEPMFDTQQAPPRVRRSDAHPDAPTRLPIFAGRDLGDPVHALPHVELETMEEELELVEERVAAPAVFVEAAQVDEDDSIAGLMQRFERGLAGRTGTADGVSAVQNERFPSDDRLSGAIADLQRLAARSS
jgi:hypothetical protein